MSRYERGECNINIENLHTLANALDTEMICFFIDDVFINKESN
ncbi:hypothetical protein AB6F61_10075 [Providencia hangzhouensis]